ncbi:hypothetical protein SEA_BBQVALINDRA_42 [Gordonia phage BBQValindra]|nr:hypothetical protein SEA_BBQVALINDRA_42 [Gordonia phage BBQValindra]
MPNEETAGPSGAAIVTGKAADRPAQPFPDLDIVDLLSVSDCDADAIVAWRRTVHGPSISEIFSNFGRNWRRVFVANWHPPR